MRTWTYNEGELRFNSKRGLWTLFQSEKKIFITSWERTTKGPVTAILIEEGKKSTIVVEIIRPEVDDKLLFPGEENAGHVLRLCEGLCHMGACKNEVKRSIDKLFDIDEKCKAIHIYYDLGLHLGAKKTWRGIKYLTSIPSRSVPL